MPQNSYSSPLAVHGAWSNQLCDGIQSSAHTQTESSAITEISKLIKNLGG